MFMFTIRIQATITVFWTQSGGATNSFTVNAGSTNWVQVPNNSGTRFYTTDGSVFYASATIDSDASNNRYYDWGFALVPEKLMTSQITMVGFAPGNDPFTSVSNPGKYFTDMGDRWLSKRQL